MPEVIGMGIEFPVLSFFYPSLKDSLELLGFSLTTRYSYSNYFYKCPEITNKAHSQGSILQ
jgi:hypothetical protein